MKGSYSPREGEEWQKKTSLIGFVRSQKKKKGRVGGKTGFISEVIFIASLLSC